MELSSARQEEIRGKLSRSAAEVQGRVFSSKCHFTCSTDDEARALLKFILLHLQDATHPFSQLYFRSIWEAKVVPHPLLQQPVVQVSFTIRTVEDA